MAATRRSTRQQAASGGTTDAAGAAAAGHASPPPPTRGEILRFALLQHSGLMLCVAGVVLLCVGYDAGWIHNTHLSILSLGLCLLGLFFHETRPVNREEHFTKIMEDRLQQSAGATKAD